MTAIEKQLEELGLSANEVRVYLASLELGSATKQQLAAKAVVARPTTYVAVEGLMKRGLMSSYVKGKKEFVQAEKPERLLKILEDEKRRLAERESKLKSLLPGLESLIAMSGDKPEVKYYEGLEGLEAMRAVLFESKVKRFDGICNLEKLRKIVPEESRVLYGLRAKKAGISGRQIIISKSGRELMPLVAPIKWQYKVMKNESTNTRGEIAIFGEFISLIVYSEKPFGILIKSKDIADLARLMFESTWKGLK